MNPPITEGKCSIKTFVFDEHIPAPDDRDENGRGDDKHTNKEKENIASHQNQLPAHVQRSMPEDVCSIDVEPAGAKKGDKKRGKKQNQVSFQYKIGYTKEVGVGLTTWRFERVGIKGYQA